MLPGLLTNVHQFHDWITNLLRASCCTFMFKGPWFSSMDMLITCDPANINHIFNTNFKNYPKGEEFSEIFDFLGDGIFTVDGESWRLQRKKAHNFITDHNFKEFLIKSSNSKVYTELIPLLRQLAGEEKETQVVDLQDVFLKFTFDATCELVFGVNPKSLSLEFPTIPFSKAMDETMTVMFLRHIMPARWWKLLRWLNVGEEKKLARARKVIDQFIAEAIKKKRDKHGNIREDCDLLTSYIKDTNSMNDIQESNKILRDATMNLMLAGRDTTGSALTWFFWLLSKNKQVEEKIIEELKQYSLEKKEEIDSEELGKLVYLHAALCESLRLYPPVPFEHKGVVNEEVLPSGDKVKPGVKIVILIYAMGRMKGIWGEDCMEFKPERWITDKGKLRHEPSFKFLSFNAGPRTCLGKEVAFVQMKTVVAAMISRFHVHVVEDHVVEAKCSVILHMKNGLMVKITERE
ncbi:Cytochrome P450 E-class group I protein [Dioscorea alata]|uniref:Cytochrome P450 E-class group I protein n=1 Tax=Dioscorea alata TaxID=55571 RepID=A0ACB7WSA9_DIOAL|nr:Cytochrome P450 E-class group I protein [Dioscorea alata]